jgi:hypothetical protein
MRFPSSPSVSTFTMRQVIHRSETMPLLSESGRAGLETDAPSNSPKAPNTDNRPPIEIKTAPAQLRSLKATQLKKYRNLTTAEQRLAYRANAERNGFNTKQYIRDDGKLNGKGKLLAGADDALNKLTLTGYYAFSYATISAGIPGTERLIEAVDELETKRKAKRHAMQDEPFASDPAAIVGE